MQKMKCHAAVNAEMKTADIINQNFQEFNDLTKALSERLANLKSYTTTNEENDKNIVNVCCLTDDAALANAANRVKSFVSNIAKVKKLKQEVIIKVE